MWSIVTGLGQTEWGESALGGRDEFLAEGVAEFLLRAYRLAWLAEYFHPRREPIHRRVTALHCRSNISRTNINVSFYLFSVTNPIDVIKIRMQLDNELGSKNNSKNIFKDRYYRGFIRGATRIFSEEGFSGLYKG